MALYNKTVYPVFDWLDKSTAVFTELEIDESARSGQERQAVLKATEREIGIAVAVTLLLGLVTISVLTHIVASPLRELTFATNEVAKRKLILPHHD